MIVIGSIGDAVEMVVLAGDTRTIMELDLCEALILQAQVDHAVAAARSWRPPQSLADVLG